MTTTQGRHGSDSIASTNLDPLTPAESEKTTDQNEQLLRPPNPVSAGTEAQTTSPAENDVFGNEEGAAIHYKTCEWWYGLTVLNY